MATTDYFASIKEMKDEELLRLVRKAEHMDAVYRLTDGVPVSISQTCKILHIGHVRARKMMGTKIRVIDDHDGRSYNVNLADVLRLAGKRI